MITLYRLSAAKFPTNSGVGAATFGGRWNRVGTPVIYASETASLAALEVLVHYSVLPKDFVLTEIQLPAKMRILRCEEAALPAGWRSEAIIPETQNLGELWVQHGRAAVLSVPSSIIATERNFVINPNHPGFKRIRFQPSLPFHFDARLKS